jgi:hypothetical protein
MKIIGMSSRFCELSINDLQEHWSRIDALKEGEFIEALYIGQMPPWSAICEKLGWEVHQLSGGHFSAKNHGFYGVYRLIALENAADLASPARLVRVSGEDPSGTLYIGEASDLSLRLNQMRRSARKDPSERSHGAINMLRQIQRLEYPAEKLAVAFIFTGKDTRLIERHLLHAYINSFGEMPPLNYRL